MIGWLLRMIASLALALAAIVAVVDAARSIAADALALTSFAEAWAAVAPGALDAAMAFGAASGFAALWQGAMAALLAVPACLVLAFLALILFALGTPGRSAGRRLTVGR